MGLVLAALLALGACAAGDKAGDGVPDRELPRFDRQLQDTIGGA